MRTIATAELNVGSTLRLPAVDVMRGLVIFLLVPDLTGGFSFHRIAERFPDNELWATLGHQFTHATWTSPRLWDFVMPAFVFLVGVGIHLSYVARQSRGQPFVSMLGHAVRRAIALIILGLLLAFPVKTWAAELWPYIVIGAFFPLSEFMARWRDLTPSVRESLDSAQMILTALVLAACAMWIATNLDQAGSYDLNNILTQLGLAYLPAFLLVRLSAWRQFAVGTLLLALYAIAFITYSPPPGTLAVGEVLPGIAAHWNNGTNVAAAFDLWLLNELPRSSPYVGNALGAHTLQFVALVPTMIAGILAARYLLHGRETVHPMRRWIPLVTIGAGAIVVGLVLSSTFIPLVKWLWTPSWAVFSAGVCLIWLALLSMLEQAMKSHVTLTPFVVLGSNSILLYVIAAHDRWRILDAWTYILGDQFRSVAYAPLLEAFLVLLAVWIMAYALFRARIFFRL